MDLVDIDKVLDDLELNEDKNNLQNILNKQTNLTARKDNKNDVSNSRDPSSSSFHQDSSSKILTPTSSSSNYSNEGYGNNKKFVAVSQVFSSLDDYCRNVESLQLDIEKIECDPQHNDFEQIGQQLINNPKETIKSNETENKKTINQESNNKDELEIENENDSSDDEEDNENLVDEEESSGSSITTSSPSSFSSGPGDSSALGDNEQSPPVKLKSKSKEKAHNNNFDTQKDIRVHDEENLIKINGGDAFEKSGALNSQMNDSIGITTGLSSISSNLLQNDETMSSMPGGSANKFKCDNTDVITGTTEDLDCNDDDEIQSIDLISTDSLSGLGSNVQTTAENIQHKLQAELLNTIDDKFINDNLQVNKNIEQPRNVVVGFGSTMDEISDTELDSMLQEIDNELNYSPNGGTCDNNCFGVISEIDKDDSGEANYKEEQCQKQENDTISDQPVCSQATNLECFTNNVAKQEELVKDNRRYKEATSNNSTNTSEYVISSVNDSESDETNNLDDLQNADSFSQASTIEFAELRLQSDFGSNVPGDNINYDPDMKTDESVIKPILENQVENFNEHIDEDELSTSSNSGTKNLTSNDKLNASQQQQRPNSLDLQQLPESSSPTIADNLNATAGQTPPAALLPSILNNANEAFNDTNNSNNSNNETVGANNNNNSQLGKIPPFWIPDNEALSCMQCKLKFTLIKRRHHCRACGQVLCSQCCSQKSKLEFLGEDASEVRVCIQCYLVLNQQQINSLNHEAEGAVGGSPTMSVTPTRSPNPNNPMEYCSTVPPLQQAQQDQRPISVMVPVGVLKRDGQPSKNKDRNVIFSDGIRPGCDLADLDNSWDDAKSSSKFHRNNGGHSKKTNNKLLTNSAANTNNNNARLRKQPQCDETKSYIPKEKNGLPPIYYKTQEGDYEYKEVQNNLKLLERLQTETLQFALQRNLYIFAKVIKLKCCINKTVINITTMGMHHVGQDEIIILLELDFNNLNHHILPKDLFLHLNEIYCDADKGHPIQKLGFSMAKHSEDQPFLGSREHGGFLYIRPSFQCLQELHLPEPPYLIGLLIHRWEVPWAKIFPLRLMLRLGAQYRYYPSPHISIRERDSVYAEIAQTIINFLADFRNYTYTLSTIKGMYIHMEDRKTTVLIPKNRFDQVLKTINNSTDYILALGGNFSKKADGHLVCIQNMESDCPDTHTYSTQAINIQGQPRKVTGASFIVLNGALKTTTGLSGKCSIVEDGLMVQILPQKMQSVRTALTNMKDVEMICGPVDADESQTEVVCIKWTENDVEFNIGVKSPIDMKTMDGIPSIRVHSGAGLTSSNTNHIIRWTEVFIIQSDEDSSHNKDPIDMSKLSEKIARSTSMALSSFLDLLATSGCRKIGLRATLHQDNVCYESGSQNAKLAPLYMNALDNELIPILHKQATVLELESPIILELIFHILDK